MDVEKKPTSDGRNILAVLEFSPKVQVETRDWVGTLIKSPGMILICTIIQS